jgi:hypothetical protein
MALRNDNYINIQGWMYKLGLTKLNELNAYAIIHGFSQDAESVYKGGYSYMADLLLCDKRTVMRILTELENKGLIIKSQKEINGVKFNRYKVSDYSLTFCQGGCQNITGGSENLTHKNNNIENKEESIINNTKEKKKPKQFDLTFIAAEFTPLMTEWLEYKLELGESYKTVAGIKKAYNNLVKFSQGNIEIAQVLIDYAIAHEWKGIWELDLRKLRTWKESQGCDSDKLRDIFRMMDEDMKLRQM